MKYAQVMCVHLHLGNYLDTVQSLNHNHYYLLMVLGHLNMRPGMHLY